MNLKVSEFISSFSYLWDTSSALVLNDERVIDFIAENGINSGKTAAESVLMFLSAVRYISGFTGGYEINTILAKYDDIQVFLRENRTIITELFEKSSVQANFPERALSVLEIIGKKSGSGDYRIIELGASAGLIGKCLLNYSKPEEMQVFFRENQKHPETVPVITGYTGIEITPPSDEWLIACFSEQADRKRISLFMDKFRKSEGFTLIEGSAFDFPGLIEANGPYGSNTVILTSFILYQFDAPSKARIISLIENFCREHGCNWLNQMVEVNEENSEFHYCAEWNGEKIMSLSDDRCNSWEWL